MHLRGTGSMHLRGTGSMHLTPPHFIWGGGGGGRGMANDPSQAKGDCTGQLAIEDVIHLRQVQVRTCQHIVATKRVKGYPLTTKGWSAPANTVLPLRGLKCTLSLLKAGPHLPTPCCH